MVSFREKWLATVDRKGSVLCAGLDPAEYAMGRGSKGLPEGVNKREWSLSYVRAVAPYAAAVKPNVQYWQGPGDPEALRDISALARALGMVVIEDRKLADIGDTNDAGEFYASQNRADAVTFSPFAGNLREAVTQAHSRGLGLISMCLMSNPEFAREKAKLVDIGDGGATGYDVDDTFVVGEKRLVPQYIQLAHDAREYGADGIVIGAPSSKNHITRSEIGKIFEYAGRAMLVLLPGIGAQGGEAGEMLGRGPPNVIVNVGRDLMFPGDNNRATPEQQAEQARYYRDTLNRLRGAA